MGNYWSAQHKFQKALKLDPINETAQFELDIVERIIELDQQIPLDSVPSIRKNMNTGGGFQTGKEGSTEGTKVCARACNNASCSIF